MGRRTEKGVVGGSQVQWRVLLRMNAAHAKGPLRSGFKARTGGKAAFQARWDIVVGKTRTTQTTHKYRVVHE